MEFRRGHLAYFVAVAEDGQITSAARRLHIAQPALSQAIAQLEADLGVELLHRHARGVSLTPAGEAFLVKARNAIAAWSEAISFAQSVGGAVQGTIEFGFIGLPPGIDSPVPLEAFAFAQPHVDIRYHELPFPGPSTSEWLADVDLAVSHKPPPDSRVWTERLRREARVILVPSRHRLAERTELELADVLEETFIGLHPSVDAGWAGFWSLDDHRGGPPASVTRDRAATAPEVLAALSVRDAITAVPASVARALTAAGAPIEAVRVRGVAPSTLVLTGLIDRCTPAVAALRAFATELGTGGSGARVEVGAAEGS
jgi:DNA-binding transcriptional LysR family regulator